MCGIIGSIHLNKNPDATKNIISDLLFVDTLRGVDSTGIAKVTPDNKVSILKSAIPGYDFVQSARFHKHMAGQSRLMIGHNRNATKGVVNTENAHPFQAKHITLVHNGTLWAWHNLVKDNYDTDSETIANLFAEINPNHFDYKDALEQLEGAYALVWYNSITKQLNLARNKERPMHIMFTEDNRILFASERNMLEWVAIRYGLKGYSIDELPIGQQWFIDIENEKSIKDGFKYFSFTPKVVNNTYGSYKGGWGKVWNESKNVNLKGKYSFGQTIEVTCDKQQLEDIIKNNKPTSVVVKSKENKEDEFRTWWITIPVAQELLDGINQGKVLTSVIDSLHDPLVRSVKIVDGTIPGYAGERLTQEDYDSLTKDGCMECGCELTQNNIRWLGADLPVCKDCAKPTHIESAKLLGHYGH